MMCQPHTRPFGTPQEQRHTPFFADQTRAARATQTPSDRIHVTQRTYFWGASERDTDFLFNSPRLLSRTFCDTPTRRRGRESGLGLGWRRTMAIAAVHSSPWPASGSRSSPKRMRSCRVDDDPYSDGRGSSSQAHHGLGEIGRGEGVRRTGAAAAQRSSRGGGQMMFSCAPTKLDDKYLTPLFAPLIVLRFLCVTPPCCVLCSPHPQGATMEGNPRSAGSLEHGEGQGEEWTAVGSK